MRKTLLLAMVACAISLVFATPGWAATRVSGLVRDINTKGLIKGAVVRSGKYSAKTNSRGYYSLKLPAGRKTLSVSVGRYITTYQVNPVTSGKNNSLNWYLTRAYPRKPVPAGSVKVLAWNDLGMHCDQDSYKYFMVLPPYNTLHAQVFGGGGDGGGGGYTITYAFAKKADSTLHTDFWTYASNFGYNVAPNVGITGNGLTGTMQPDGTGRGYVATGIPVTPYDDDGTWDPYGAATLTVRRNGVVVATTNVVTPVSTEMSCANCHGSDPFVDILTKHDTNVGTTMLADANAGHPHSCSECHADNALGAPGQAGVESLSLAMHKHHDGLSPNTTAGCYNCHPGPKTACLRGIMERAGKGCVSCHGTMTTVWQSQASAGRQAWVNEPKCATCHGSKFAENSGKLYRNSLLGNTYEDMSGRIYCEACHNSTHAEYTTANASDTVVTKAAQGDTYWIYNCAVCHRGGEENITFRGQTVHR